MLSVIETTASTSIVAHPVTEPFQIPVSPATAAGVAAVVVLGVALVWPQRRGSRSEDGPGIGAEERAGPRRLSSGTPPDRPLASWEGGLSPLQWIARVAAILSLVIAIAAADLASRMS